MRNRFTIVLLFFINIGFAQNFSISKIIYNDQELKLKGSIKLTDNLISITSNELVDTYEIRKVYESGDVKQFKGNGIGEDTTIRVTLKKPEIPTKQKPITLLYETKDTFSNTYIKILYFLKEQQ